jgi:hypothetical protein
MASWNTYSLFLPTVHTLAPHNIILESDLKIQEFVCLCCAHNFNVANSIYIHMHS